MRREAFGWAKATLRASGRRRAEDLQGAGVCLSTPRGNAAKTESAVHKSRFPKSLFVIAALTVTISAAPAPSRASGGNAPWCAIIDYGDGGVSWECVYRSFEECYPNVIAGNKGSCNVNPAGSSASASAATAKHRKHQARRAQN